MPSPAIGAEPQVRAFSVAIRDGVVAQSQRNLSVPHQSPVRIEWSADRLMTVHLEGYNLSVTVRPGAPALMQFKGYATGRFAVHAHDGERGASSGHAHGRSVLLRLEVHPL